VIEVRRTDIFSRWLDQLRDDQAIARILTRIHRLSLGNFGDVKSVGVGVSELRIDYGPGYRVYFTRIGSVIVLLLVGGTKRTQQKDIERAKAMVKEIDNGS
jgi:putative addiction module killer protein